MRTLEHLVIGLTAFQLLRLWWRLKRSKVKQWLQRVKDQGPLQRHPKSPKDCPHCCWGLRLETARINAE